MKQPVITLPVWTVKGIVICFGISLSQQFEENAVVLCPLACLQRDNARPHTARHTVKQVQDLELEVLPRPSYSPDLAPGDVHLFWPLKRRSPWTSLQIGWGAEGGGAWLDGTANKRLLLPINLCLSGTLEEACRTWWGLHWRLVSLCCIYFCNKSLCTFFPGFYLNGPCTTRKHQYLH
jgi:hypothetical protein